MYFVMTGLPIPRYHHDARWELTVRRAAIAALEAGTVDSAAIGHLRGNDRQWLRRGCDGYAGRCDHGPGKWLIAGLRFRLHATVAVRLRYVFALLFGELP
jgi:hypothetical protein